MTNLLKSKPRIFKKELSAREVYETERYYLLKVVDISGCLEKELRRCDSSLSIEEFVEKLFEAQQNSKLSRYVYKFLDIDRLNIDCTIQEMSRGTSIAVIIVSKKRINEKVKGVYTKFLKRIYDANNMDDF